VIAQRPVPLGLRRPGPRLAPPPRGCAARAGAAPSPRHAGPLPSEVTTPIARGIGGSGRLRAGSNRPSASSRARRFQKLLVKCALPGHRLRLSTTSCRSPRASYTPSRPRGSHQFAVAWRKVQQAGGAAEHGAADLTAVVLDRKVTMAAGRAGRTGDLPAHHHRVEARLQRVSHGAAQRANLPHPPRQTGRFDVRGPVHATIRQPCGAAITIGRGGGPSGRFGVPSATQGLVHDRSRHFNRSGETICFPSYKPPAGRSGPCIACSVLALAHGHRTLRQPARASKVAPPRLLDEVHAA